MIHTEVGYDCAKQIKGRKRHVLVDTLGLLIVVVVTAANLPERAGAKLVFAQVKKEHSKFWRLVKIWVDGGYSIHSYGSEQYYGAIKGRTARAIARI